jgi:hypothetical protein
VVEVRASAGAMPDPRLVQHSALRPLPWDGKCDARNVPVSRRQSLCSHSVINLLEHPFEEHFPTSRQS